MGDGPALGRVFAFGLDGEQVVTEHIEFAFGKSLMVQLTAFGRRCDGIEHPYLSNACFSVVRNQLVPVGGHPYTWKWSFSLHDETTSAEIRYYARVSVLENQESRSRIFNFFLGCVNVLRLGCNTRL